MLVVVARVYPLNSFICETYKPILSVPSRFANACLCLGFNGFYGKLGLVSPHIAELSLVPRGLPFHKFHFSIVLSYRIVC